MDEEYPTNSEMRRPSLDGGVGLRCFHVLAVSIQIKFYSYMSGLRGVRPPSSDMAQWVRGAAQLLRLLVRSLFYVPVAFLNPFRPPIQDVTPCFCWGEIFVRPKSRIFNTTFRSSTYSYA